MQFRTAYNYDADSVSRETGLSIDPDEDQTQQQFAEDSDINEIVRRFGITGQLPDNFAPPMSGDFTNLPNDYHSMLNAVRNAEDKFMDMPAELRARFRNDPGQLISFLDDPNNHAEAVALKLIAQPENNDRTGQPLPAPVASAAPNPGTTKE